MAHGTCGKGTAEGSAFLCRDAVGRIHGKEAAEQAHIHSLQGLCTLLLPKDIPSRQRDAELAARQSALVDAVASPVSCTLQICAIPLLSSPQSMLRCVRKALRRSQNDKTQLQCFVRPSLLAELLNAQHGRGLLAGPGLAQAVSFALVSPPSGSLAELAVIAGLLCGLHGAVPGAAG